MSNVASIDAARRLASVDGARAVEHASWEFADALVADVPDDETRVSSSHARTGAYQALRLIAEQLGRAGFDYSAGSLRQYRATSLAWPEPTRVHEGAGFTVHRELRGREDRAEVLGKLIRQHGGRVTQKQVRTWKQEQNPPAFKSWGDTMRSRIKAITRNAVSPSARAQMADLLREAARELDDE